MFLRIMSYGCACLLLSTSLVVAGEPNSADNNINPESKPAYRAENKSDPNLAKVGEFDYPELSVVPRASDRLHEEAEKEHLRKWTTFLPIQISGLATLVGGVASFNPNNSNPSYTGIGVGAGWLIASTILAAAYSPYMSSDQEIYSMPKGSEREQLARERAADAEIQRIAALGVKLKWLSVITNLGASVAMLAGTKDGDMPSSGLRRGHRFYQAAAAALAFTPLLFSFHWSDVASEQEEYKKRIYSPVATAMPTVFQDRATGAAIPGMMLSVSF